MTRTKRDETPHTVIYTIRVGLTIPVTRGMIMETRTENFPTAEEALNRKDRLVREYETVKTEHLYYAAVLRDSDGYSISSSTHSPRPERPICKCPGNVAATLRKAGLTEKVTEFQDKLQKCGSYDEALVLMGEYVEIR